MCNNNYNVQCINASSKYLYAMTNYKKIDWIEVESHATTDSSSLQSFDWLMVSGNTILELCAICVRTLFRNISNGSASTHTSTKYTHTHCRPKTVHGHRYRMCFVFDYDCDSDSRFLFFFHIFFSSIRNKLDYVKLFSIVCAVENRLMSCGCRILILFVICDL